MSDISPHLLQPWPSGQPAVHRHSLVIQFPGIGAVLGHELQVLNTDRLVLQLRHGVVHTLLPGGDVILLARGGRRQLVPAQK